MTLLESLTGVVRQVPEIEELRSREFPCPVCGLGLAIRFSRKGKPYCVCDACGIQLFFRGKPGIARLCKLVESGVLVSGKDRGATPAVTLYNRLQQLKTQREELEAKQGIIFRDTDLDHTIEAVDAEIETVQGELAKLARRVRREKKK